MKDFKFLRRTALVVLTLLALAGVFRVLLGDSSPSAPGAAAIDAAIEKEREKVTEAEAEEDSDHLSPVDFDALQAVNQDICAWLSIPGTEISYPILFHSSDNSYYLSHAENGQQSPSGSLFMEDYNSRDCSDPALVVYGHHMRSGAYFGNLQEAYETQEAFEAHREILLYLPQKTLRFRVFAAVPYNDTHLLYTYHFSNLFDFNDFMNRITVIRSFSAQMDPDNLPHHGDQLLILSTCLKGDNTKRYLVIGAAKEVSPE